MHLTDVAVRRQLFLDVLDGTKALVSIPESLPSPEVTERAHDPAVGQGSNGLGGSEEVPSTLHL